MFRRASGAAVADGAASAGGVYGVMAVVDQTPLELSRRATPDGQQVVTLRGEIDIATAGRARNYLYNVVDSESLSVIVDLSGVTFCDAAGLGMLAKVASRARKAGHPVRLVGARPALLRIMRITGLDAAFPELQAPTGTVVSS
jgi:anti-sigma B factor antagonist